MVKTKILSLLGITSSLFFAPILIAAPGNTPVYTSQTQKDFPIDYAFQGEYLGSVSGKTYGCQVISLGDGAFQAVVLPGGLPGNGWDGENKSLLNGTLQNGKIAFKAPEGNLKYLHQDPKQFSATNVFPPKGQKSHTGLLEGDSLKLTLEEGGELTLSKTLRKSPTLGLTPPGNAIVLFDGSNIDQFNGGRLDAETKWLNTDGSDIRTVKKFKDYTIHLEFMLPYRPLARGQGRGNSGVYHVDKYETQVLDTFGLMGLDNECGGIYKQKVSDVNMCLPPLTWQTYDVTFKSAVVENGVKVKNARITAKLNGVLIHNDFELTGPTGGAANEPEGTPGAIRLQGHGNPLQYRNIWIVEE